MKKTMFKRIAALSAALMLISGAAVSCGKVKDEKNEPKTMMSASYHAVEIETDAENIRDIVKVKDGFVVTGSSEKDNTPIFYFMDSDFNQVSEMKPDFKLNEGELENVSFYTTISSDSEIYAMAEFTDYGDAEQPNFDDPNFDYEHFDWEKYEKSISYTRKLYTVDLEGNVTNEAEVTGLEELCDAEKVSVSQIYPCGEGKIAAYVFGDESEVTAILGADGKAENELEIDDFDSFNSIVAVDDKTLAVSGYTDKGAKIVFVDSTSLEPTGDEITSETAGDDIMYGTLCAGNADYKLLTANNTGLYGLKDDNTSEEVINWLDSDLAEGFAQAVVSLDNGEYIMYYNEYSSEMSGALYRLTKRDASELENMKVVTIASLQGDWAVKEQVSDFNKSHEDVRIKVIDYSKYDEYDDEGNMTSSGETQLKNDIISGETPDMLLTSGGAFVYNLGSKDLLEDLYSYMDKDDELTREDVVPNILKAGEINGKLMSLSDSFTISTLVAKKKFVDKDSWTADELISTYEKRSNKDMHLFGSNTRADLLSLVYYALFEKIDYEKGTCNFKDDPEFKKMLEFVEKFDTIDLEDEEATEEYFEKQQEYYSGGAFKNEKVLLDELGIYDVDGIVTKLNGEYVGEDICFIGYPTNKENGAVMTTSTSYSILSTSENKDVCWEFIKSLFTKDISSDDSGNMYYMGIPSYKKSFDAFLDKTMKKPSYVNGDGQKEEYDYYFYDGSEEGVPVEPLSKEQRDFVADFILSSTTSLNAIDSDAESIISEELMAYVSGEKTADEVVELLQDRISLKLSEQS